MQVTGNVAGCLNAVLSLPCEMSAVNTSGAAAYRAVPAARAMILAHMVMNGGKCKTEGLAGMGPSQRQADKAWQGKTRPL